MGACGYDGNIKKWIRRNILVNLYLSINLKKNVLLHYQNLEYILLNSIVVLIAGLPRCLDDDYNYKEDIETDKIDNRSGHTKKSRGNGERAALIC